MIRPNVTAKNTWFCHMGSCSTSGAWSRFTNRKSNLECPKAAILSLELKARVCHRVSRVPLSNWVR